MNDRVPTIEDGWTGPGRQWGPVPCYLVTFSLMMSHWWESKSHHHIFLLLQNVDGYPFSASYAHSFWITPWCHFQSGRMLKLFSVFPVYVMLWVISAFLLSYLNSHLSAEEKSGQQKDGVPWSTDASSWERSCLSVTNAHEERGPWGSCAVHSSSLALLECRVVPVAAQRRVACASGLQVPDFVPQLFFKWLVFWFGLVHFGSIILFGMWLVYLGVC